MIYIYKVLSGTVFTFAAHNRKGCVAVVGIKSTSLFDLPTHSCRWEQTLQRSCLACMGYISNKGAFTLYSTRARAQLTIQ